MGKSKKEIIDDKRYSILFFNANAYKETFYLLLSNPNQFGTECNIFSPIAVNGLLAVELYLKYLCAVDMHRNKMQIEIPKVHSMNELFSNLIKERQKQIKDELLNKGCTIDEWRKFRRTISSAEKNKGKNKGKNGDAVNYRYLTTKHKNIYKLDLNTLVKIVEALYSISAIDFNYIKDGNQLKIKVPEKSKNTLPVFSTPQLDNISRDIINHSIYIEDAAVDNYTDMINEMNEFIIDQMK